MSNYYIGVDVGTGSARAGIFTEDGKMLGSASKNITMWKYDNDFVEQSSDNIWESVCWSIKKALELSNIDAAKVKGIGIDATCSLVALDKNDMPVSVSKSNDDDRNVIVWMDHRAISEAEFINTKKHKVLDYVGGKISPEMETPKLLWLKKYHKKCWERTALFFDLPDFLVYKATGKDVRSLCSTVCKWTYMGHEDSNIQTTIDFSKNQILKSNSKQPVKQIKNNTPGYNPESIGSWSDNYFNEIGLEDLVNEKYKRIGQKVRPIGENVPGGLTTAVAEKLGLKPGTAVGISLIDAHAGGIGLLGAVIENESFSEKDLNKRLALIGGTSSCHMAVSPTPNFVPGVWGPYYSAMIPNMWLAEGGQSATGALVDHIIFSHARSADLMTEAEKKECTVYELLNDRLEKLSKELNFPALLTKDIHVLPYFHGNRSPRANPLLKGVISGLKLSDTLDELSLQYLATIQAIAYGTRHIIEEMNKNGFDIDTIFACGGGTKNPVFLREHADITGCRIILPEEQEAVLLGSAILGAAASGDVDSVVDGMKKMNRTKKIITPSKETEKYHTAKYKVFHKMYEDQNSYKEIMEKSI